MCFIFSSLTRFGGEEGRGYSGMLSGYQSGEPSTIRAIFGEGIGGNIKVVARKASAVNFLFSLASSILRFKTSTREYGQLTADQILFSSSVSILA